MFELHTFTPEGVQVVLINGLVQNDETNLLFAWDTKTGKIIGTLMRWELIEENGKKGKTLLYPYLIFKISFECKLKIIWGATWDQTRNTETDIV